MPTFRLSILSLRRPCRKRLQFVERVAETPRPDREVISSMTGPGSADPLLRIRGEPLAKGHLICPNQYAGVVTQHLLYASGLK